MRKEICLFAGSIISAWTGSTMIARVSGAQVTTNQGGFGYASIDWQRYVFFLLNNVPEGQALTPFSSWPRQLLERSTSYNRRSTVAPVDFRHMAAEQAILLNVSQAQECHLFPLKIGIEMRYTCGYTTCYQPSSRYHCSSDSRILHAKRGR